MYTINYTADYSSLIDNANGNADDINAIENSYDAYVKFLTDAHGDEIEIDYDGGQTTYCNSGDEPDGFLDFWAWYNK